MKRHVYLCVYRCTYITKREIKEIWNGRELLRVDYLSTRYWRRKMSEPHLNLCQTFQAGNRHRRMWRKAAVDDVGGVIQLRFPLMGHIHLHCILKRNPKIREGKLHRVLYLMIALATMMWDSEFMSRVPYRYPSRSHSFVYLPSQLLEIFQLHFPIVLLWKFHLFFLSTLIDQAKGDKENESSRVSS